MSEGEGEPTAAGSPSRRQSIGAFAIVASTLFSNRKIRRVGAHGALVFVFALLRNAEKGRTGSFPASELEAWYVADQLQINEQEASRAIQACVQAGLLEIDGDVAYVTGWDESWARRALTESESRMLRRQKNKSENKKEKKRERERERSPDAVRTVSGQPARVEKIPLPDDWTPNAAHEATAARFELDLAKEVEKLRRWAIREDARFAGPKGWDSRFVDWLMKASEYAQRDKPAGTRRSAPVSPNNEDTAFLPRSHRGNYYDDPDRPKPKTL